MAPSWDLSHLATPRQGLLGKQVQRWCSTFGIPSSPALTSLQVYQQFFDSFPFVPDETHEQDLWDGFGPSKRMTQLEVRSSAACKGMW